MLKIASVPNMDYVTFVNRAAQEFDWYESNGSQRNGGNLMAERLRSIEFDPQLMIGNVMF
jgi:hypothetical protein